MRAMVLERAGEALVLRTLPAPAPAAGQVLIEVEACGVCRTDLHLLDGELPDPAYPVVPGHEIVGRVAALGAGVTRFALGQRVGVPWLGYTCGVCESCRRGQENLCDSPGFTGYTLPGGFAELTVADERYCFPLPDEAGAVATAPLLCAGLIGYRTYRLAGEHVARLGIYGFGAAAHIVAQVAVFEGKQVYAFVRPGDTEGARFARELGAIWAGESGVQPPEPLDAALLFAPVGSLVPAALAAVRKGGVVVCGGIHMSDIPSFPYHLLWHERVLRSVANLTRRDGEELLALAPRVPVRTITETFALPEANEALARLRTGGIHGAVVLVMR
jgi:propanol-preferring alcohol dehydrogenase